MRFAWVIVPFKMKQSRELRTNQQDASQNPARQGIRISV